MHALLRNPMCCPLCFIYNEGDAFRTSHTVQQLFPQRESSPSCIAESRCPVRHVVPRVQRVASLSPFGSSSSIPSYIILLRYCPTTALLIFIRYKNLILGLMGRTE